MQALIKSENPRNSTLQVSRHTAALISLTIKIDKQRPPPQLARAHQYRTSALLCHATTMSNSFPRSGSRILLSTTSTSYNRARYTPLPCRSWPLCLSDVVLTRAFVLPFSHTSVVTFDFTIVLTLVLILCSIFILNLSPQ